MKPLLQKLLFLCFVAISVASNGQTFTIGSGTAANTSSSYPAPYGNFYTGARHQFLYRSTELQAVSATNGIITQFGFNVTATNGTAPILGLTIKMGQASVNVLTAFQTGLTTVYTSTSYTPVTGWNLHTLTTPFALDPTMNLIVEVCFSNGTSYNYSYNVSTQWTTGLPANTTIYNRSDLAGNGCPNTAINSTTAAAQTSRPNCRFVLTAGAAMSYSSTFLSQNNAYPIRNGGTNQEIMRIAVVTSGYSSPLGVTQFTLNTNGTTVPANITRARIYSTGTSKQFDTTNLFGSALNPSGSFNISGSKTLSSDSNFFWLTYDISGASFGNTFDAECSQVTVSSTNYPVAVSAPAGSRTLLAPLNGTYSVGTGQTYTSLPDAITALYYRGISGATNFLLTDNNYTLTSTLNIEPFQNPGNDLLTISPSNTASINGNISGSLIKITTGNIMIDGANTSAPNQRNLTLSNISTSSPQVISIASTGTNTLQHISIKNTIIINGTNTSSAVTFMDAGGSTGGYFNDVNMINNSISKAYIGMYIWSASSASSGILIDSTEFSSSGGNQIRLVGLYMQGVNNATISKNTIGNFEASSAELKTGIWIATDCRNIVIERNKIVNIGTLAASNCGMGIRVSTGLAGANISIRNNFIDNIYGTGSATFHANSNPAGITLHSTQSGIQIVYNTIKLSGSSLAGTQGNSAGIRLLTGSSADIRNNYINNTLGAAIPVGTTIYGITLETSASQLTAINANNYYVGGGFGTTSVGRIAFSNYPTLSDWKNVVTADILSISENTPFISGTDMHIPASTVSSMESGAVAIAGINTDIDGDTRSGTFPDIGADEFIGVINDITPPLISFSPLNHHNSTTTRNVTGIEITDISGVNTTTGTAPRLYYKKKSNANTFGANTPVTNGWKWVEASNTTSPFNFNMDYSLIYQNPVLVNDTIEYFVVATDNATSPNTISQPAAGFSGTSVAVITSAPTTPYFYKIAGGPLSGVYLIGATQVAPNYTTITAAANDISARGVSGPVTFSLTDASYGVSETFPIVFESIAGASALNQITIKPATGVVLSTISGSSSSAIIKLNGADYITIDGSATPNGSTQNLQIANTNTNSGGNGVIWLASVSAVNGCEFNTMKNMSVRGNITSVNKTQFLIYSGNQTSQNTTSPALAKNQSNRFENIGFSFGQFGLFLHGPSTASTDSNNTVHNCTFTTLELNAVVLINQTNDSITNNTTQSTGGAVAGLSLTDINGIVAPVYLRESKNCMVSRNKISIFYVSNGSVSRLYGICTDAPSYSSSGTPSNNTIANNFISQPDYQGNGTGWNITGIGLHGGYGDKVYYNSVLFFGNNFKGSSGPSALFANGTNSQPRNCNNADVRNNIFIATGGGVSGNVYGHYTSFSNAAAYSACVANYNNYYLSLTGGITPVLAGINNTDYLTLSLWQTASAKDQNSVSKSVTFVNSFGDLHLASSSISDFDLKGIAIPGMGTDIDNDTRFSIPYMGADEVPGFPLPVNMLSFTATGTGNDVELRWITTNEKNNSGFLIERSFNGSLFTEIGFVKGQNTTNQQQVYRFTDKNSLQLAPTIYYRLKQSDMDGNYSYSNIAIVNTSTIKRNQEVSVYPNPFTSEITVTMDVWKAGTITVYDVTGRIQLTQSISDNTLQKIDATTLSAGIYYVTIEAGGVKQTFKLIK